MKTQMWWLNQIFKEATEKNFPKDECNYQSNVYEIWSGDKIYDCLLTDIKGNCKSYLIKMMKPYMWRGDTGEGYEELYGWQTVDDEILFYDNLEKPIHDEDFRVIGFREHDAVFLRVDE